MCDVVVGALSRIHLDPLRGGLDPRLVALDWSINEVVRVWGDSESAFCCSDPDLSFAFVDLWCERRLRRVLLRRSGFGGFSGVYLASLWSGVPSFPKTETLRLVSVKGYVLCSGVMMAALPCQSVHVGYCGCVVVLSPWFALAIEVWRFVLLGPLCLEPLVSHCSMFSVYMAWWFSTVRKNEWVHVLCTRSEGSVRVPDWINWISRIVVATYLRPVIPVRGGSLGLLRRPFLLFLQVLMFVVFACLSLSHFGQCPLGSRSGVAVSGVKSGLWLVWLLVSCYMNKSSTCLALWLASSS
ncbi:BnaCnng59790D [Brassica napus]|uniref:BnaCnng59790D protein n=2 Tax=Brassica TaxID=3705 RepID=A0A078JT64_BRANA|nr:BnaCnng59790D [Brassica napus]VDD46443.1 unnamed protein product [Brassica oleracea]